MSDRQAFLDAIAAAPDDEAPRKVFADWLDEQGEHEEADEYRAFEAPKRGSWIVRMKCEITKEVVCNDCTEEQARDDPFEYAVDEQEVEQWSYDVVRVEPNE